MFSSYFREKEITTSEYKKNFPFAKIFIIVTKKL